MKTECQPCQKGWILHQNKCYLFYNENNPWKTWEDSRKHCKDIGSDLVVIDTFQEQVSSNNMQTLQLNLLANFFLNDWIVFSVWKCESVNVYDNHHFNLQQFISEHIEFYYDKHHGYHIGLRKQDNNWVWIDGRDDTLG